MPKAPHSKKSVNKSTAAMPEFVFPIVGVGASAGGLVAFTQLLESIPVDIGMAFVFLQHLDPNYKSSLAAILAQNSRLPVTEIEQSQKIKRNHVYVIPENKEATIKNAVLQLHDRPVSKQPNLLINRFLSSLADDQQSNAIGIILSGAGSDGTLGLQAIKAAGGITFAQDKSAEYDSMPESAVRAEATDFVLPIPEIAQGLKTIVKHHHFQQHSQEFLAESATDTVRLLKLLRLLENHTGVPITSYKTPMLRRRIQRRLAVLNLRSLADYLVYVEMHPAELDVLYQDTLINVTSFFRDQPMLDLFTKKLLPELVENTKDNRLLRIWVAGCASGEEAYSIAITCHEYLIKHRIDLSVKIFATDINPIAIAKARSGVYTVGALENVAKSLRERYFDDVGHDNYQVHNLLREMCVFAVHNLLTDPPFSSIDFVSCANVMIYLQPVAQQKLLSTFHYALRPGGFLALGPSESIGVSRSLFSPLDKKIKVYGRKPVTSPLHFSPSNRLSASPNIVTERRDKISGTIGTDIATEAGNVLLSQFTPASVLINGALDIVEFYGTTSPYLEATSGKASLNILKMARPGLVLHLRKAIRHVKEKGQPYKGTVRIKLGANGQKKQIDLEAIPLDIANYAESHILVIFKEEKIIEGISSNHLPAKLSDETAKDNQIFQLERELTEQQEETRQLSDDHEIAIEELQLANEEIRSTNEELQSLNEELETSSEELASTNEELININQTLQARNEALTVARDYAEAIITTVRHPLIVLAPDLKITKVNDSFLRTFGVTEKYIVGKYLYDFGDGQWQIPELRIMLEDVATKNHKFKNYRLDYDLEDIGSRIFILNARRIRQEENNVNFILLAIEDVTEREQIKQQELQASESRQHFISESMPQKAFTALVDGTIDYFNSQWTDFTGLPFEEIKAGSWKNFIHPDDVDETVKLWKHSFKVGESFQIEHRLRRADGVYHWHLSQADPLRDNDGKIVMWAGSSTDIEDLRRTKRRTLELEQTTSNLRTQRNQLAELNKAKEEFINIASHQLRTPATGVKQYVGMILDGYAGTITPTQRKYLEQANESNDRQLQTISELLQVAQVDSGQMTLKLVSTDMVKLIQSVLDEQASQFAERQQRVTFNHKEASAFVKVDRQKIRMVFDNLIDNASKYTSAGKEIIVNLDSGINDIKISVKDQGVGIAEIDQGYLFQKFYRIHNTMSVKVGGTGLGLYVSKKVIDLHGGTIDVSSAPDKGSTFTVTLPVKK